MKIYSRNATYVPCVEMLEITLGKQKYECISCRKHFVENPQNEIISNATKERIQRALLDRVSLEGIYLIFDVRMP